MSDSDATANAVDENAEAGTAVGITASATDADATTNAITYSLLGNDGGRFAINANSGIVSVAGAIDREADGPSRNITVRATSTDGSYTDQVFTIQVRDVDEFDVGAVSDSDATANAVDENAAVGTAVGITASATDADATTNAITYTLDADAGGLFTVDTNTGVVTVAGALDYETATSHTITIRATSQDGSVSTRSFTINVIDVNESGIGPISDADAAPDFVLENAAMGTNVGVTAWAADPDGTDTVSYTLDDNAGGRFAIDAATGVVTVAGAIDRELAASYDITVRAASSDGTFTTQTFTIALGDVDDWDVGHVIDTDLVPNTVAEDAELGTLVGITALASDGDVTNNVVTYSLDDSAGGRFAIDAHTGLITVAGALDFETAASHTITIRATSTDGSYAIETFTVLVSDLPDWGPPPPDPDPTPTPDDPPPDGSDDPLPIDDTPSAAAQPVPAPARVGGWSTNALDTQRFGGTARLVDESLVSAWLTDHAVPLAIFHNVAGQWHRELLEHPESLSPAVAAAANTMGVDPALLWRKLDALLDDSQLDKVELNLRVGTAMVAASVLSVGYVLWTLRGGYLLASLLAQLPVWRSSIRCPCWNSLPLTRAGNVKTMRTTTTSTCMATVR